MWYTIYENVTAKAIFGVDKDLVAIVCLGYPAVPPLASIRKSLEEKLHFIR